jgi:hypothetical protein
VLASGPAAVLSHRSAAALWGILPTASPRTHVTVPGGSRRGPTGVVLHRTRRQHPDDRTVRDGMPVTAIARTLLDIAPMVRRRQLERAVEAAEQHELLDMLQVEQLIGRSRGRRGRRALGDVLRDYRDLPVTRCDLERRFFELCRRAGLPLPAMNLWIAGQEVDAVWQDRRLVVELDSRGFHDTRAAFERDRVRDTALQVAGYRVLRVTHRRLEGEPEEVVRAVRSLLGGVLA